MVRPIAPGHGLLALLCLFGLSSLLPAQEAEPAPQRDDLKKDPHEKSNLASDHPELVTCLSKRIADWWPVTKRKRP
jgi:hypothetical protein